MTLSGSIRNALGTDLSEALDHDIGRLGIDRSAGSAPDVTEDELSALPATVQRYLRFMGLTAGPRATTFGARFNGRFRMSPSGRWMPCAAAQFNRVDPVARLFRMRLRMGGCLPVVALDSYVSGTGAMHAEALGLVTVADGRGPEFDLGELTTWLNDAVLYTPALLLGPSTTWDSDDPGRFEVTFTDGGLTSRAVVTVDDRGAPTEFATTDRYAALPDGLVRAMWRTPVGRWRDGVRPLPEGTSAVWDLPAGPFTYVEGELDPASIELDGTAQPA